MSADAEYDVIVVGCGTMGAAACWELARRGCRVLGLDRFGPPHDRGEHHGLVRMFRMAYYEHPCYVPWLRYSLEAWRQLQAGGEPLLNLTGGLYLGRADSDLIAGSLRSAREHRLAHETMDASEIARRYPMFRVPPGTVGVLERDAGFLWCERTVGAMLRAATEVGGERFALRTGERVLSWHADERGVRVRTSAGEARGRALVVTAGAWTAEILRALGLPLTVTRQVQGWIRPESALEAWRELSCWAVAQDDGSLLYGFPMLDGEVKLARHAPGTEMDPEGSDRGERDGDAETFMPLVREHVPALATCSRRTATCMYTNSPDGHFLIDRHPTMNRVVFGCGFSGHGFKLAPAVGRMLAELAMAAADGGRASGHPEAFFSLGRLGK